MLTGPENYKYEQKVIVEEHTMKAWKYFTYQHSELYTIYKMGHLEQMICLNNWQPAGDSRGDNAPSVAAEEN